jgi:hypothetical protein
LKSGVSSGQPSVENILRAAGGTLGRVFARHGHVTIGAIPDRDAMSPPQLTADTPILDVLKPVEVGLLEAFRHDLDASVFHRVETGIGKRLDLHEPLLGDHRLDNFTAAL